MSTWHVYLSATSTTSLTKLSHHSTISILILLKNKNITKTISISILFFFFFSFFNIKTQIETKLWPLTTKPPRILLPADGSDSRSRRRSGLVFSLFFFLLFALHVDNGGSGTVGFLLFLFFLAPGGGCLFSFIVAGCRFQHRIYS